jgi:hypothetical protein
MARWSDVAAQAPDFAAAAQRILDAHRHKTIATLRRDGSPRISGIEAEIRDGDLVFGGIPDSRKAHDLLRDPRFALHSASEDPPEWSGDAKVSGRAEDVSESPSSRLFRADISDVVIVRHGGDPPDHLVIELWQEGRGLRRMERW